MINATKCEVFIWNQHVGNLVQIKGKVYFKYNPEFKLDISPLALKSNQSQYNFSDLEHQYGLPGVFADSLPDAFGMGIIDEYFAMHADIEPNILDKLLFIGDVTLGALEYRPAIDDISGDAAISVKLNELKEIKKNICKYGAYKSFSSAGGAREKALMYYDEKEESFSVAKVQHDSIPIVLKFDESHRANMGKDAIIEYIYSLVAKRAGIDMPQTYLFEDDDGYTHFGVQRYDVLENGDKQHVHSLARLLHKDKITRLDLAEFLELAKSTLYLDHSDLEEIYRRVVFNYVYNNHDDHLKNFEFLMDEDGKWSLSPAFDLTYNKKIAQKNMRFKINGKNSSDATFEDFEEVAKEYKIDNYKNIIDKVYSTREFFKKQVQSRIPKEFDYDIELYLDTKDELDIDD